MAVFLGILILHGMQPGPLMLVQNQTEIYGLVWALTASCILASFDRAVAGAAAGDDHADRCADPGAARDLRSRWSAPTPSMAQIENVVVSAVFGVLGYLMIRFDYPRLTVVVALVLGGTAERNFHQSMMMGDGNWSIFASRWVSGILLASIIILLGSPLLRALRRRHQEADRSRARAP